MSQKNDSYVAEVLDDFGAHCSHFAIANLYEDPLHLIKKTTAWNTKVQDKLDCQVPRSPCCAGGRSVAGVS